MTRWRLQELLCRLAAALAALLFSHGAGAQEARIVTLAAGERLPYIGPSLPENGYVAELATEAFKRRGYRLVIRFYPHTRARLLAEAGQVDGLLPVYHEPNRTADAKYAYSASFPGDTIGLLKNREMPFFSYSAKLLQQPESLLRALKGYRLGMVQGGVSLPLLETPGLDREMASEDVNNLDKLHHDRIQFALIDKYAAANLMATQRPQLIGTFEFLSPPLAVREFGVAFSRKTEDHARLVTVFNEGLRELQRDGTLGRILNKHGLYAPKPGTTNKVKLTIGTVNNSDMQVLQTLSEEYEKLRPEVELEWRVMDENTLRQRQLSDLSIDDGQYDVMTIGSYETSTWARRGWLVPLQPPEDYDVQDLVPTVREVLSQDGRLFALPFYAESSMTYYRKDLFAAAGLQMPAQPSYEEIRTFAARIHNPAGAVYGICLRGKPGWGENMAFISTMVNVHGGRWFDESWRPQLDTPAWTQAIALYRELLSKYGPPNPERNGFNENLALFSAGRCGIWIDATVAASQLFDPRRSKVARQFDYARAPAAMTNKGAAWLWIWALAVPTSSRNSREAIDFIQWATSKYYIQAVARRHGPLAVPPGTRISTYETGGYAKAAPFAHFVLEEITSPDTRESALKSKPYAGIQYVTIPEFAAIGEQVGHEMAKMLKGEQSEREALTRSQQRALEQMRRSGHLRGSATSDANATTLPVR